MTTRKAPWTPRRGSRAAAVRRLLTDGASHSARQLAAEAGCSISWARRVAARLARPGSMPGFVGPWCDRQRTPGTRPGAWCYTYAAWPEARDILAEEDRQAATDAAQAATTDEACQAAWTAWAQAQLSHAQAQLSSDTDPDDTDPDDTDSDDTDSDDILAFAFGANTTTTEAA